MRDCVHLTRETLLYSRQCQCCLHKGWMGFLMTLQNLNLHFIAEDLCNTGVTLLSIGSSYCGFSSFHGQQLWIMSFGNAVWIVNTRLVRWLCRFLAKIIAPAGAKEIPVGQALCIVVSLLLLDIFFWHFLKSRLSPCVSLFDRVSVSSKIFTNLATSLKTWERSLSCSLPS